MRCKARSALVSLLHLDASFEFQTSVKSHQATCSGLTMVTKSWPSLPAPPAPALIRLIRRAILPCVLIVLASGYSWLYLQSVLVQRQNFANYHNIQPLKSSRTLRVDNMFSWSEEYQHWTLQQNGHHKIPNCTCIWPEDCKRSSSDRIVDQLRLDRLSEKILKIMPHDGSYQVGQEIFLAENCPVNRCQITYDASEADALIYRNSDVIDEPPRTRRNAQIWIAYFLESPIHTFDRRFKRLHRGRHVFNWTASYRSDADIVTPYSKFVPYGDRALAYHRLKTQSRSLVEIKATYANSSAYHRKLLSGKKGKVAWFASNCNAANNRLEYARELSKYIQVDIFGRCGNLTCDKWNQTGCSDMINSDYKFYLAFENSNCRQYITEKLYRNAYGYNDLNYLVLPIVLGAPKRDYQKFAPPASFIHVDDFRSAKELADHLRQLDQDDAAYYSYFHWKTMGHFVDTKFMCRVCAMLHESYRVGKKKSYEDIESWYLSSGLEGSAGSASSCETV